MIPKMFAKENGGYQAFAPVGIHGMGAAINPAFLHNLPNNHIYIPENVVLQGNGEVESALQNHRRKMLRRAANRRSAQLSRARKKAYMEELKEENARLQRLVDALDSQPDLVFTVNADGQISYISDRAKGFIKTDENAEEESSYPSHMNQVLQQESMGVLLEALNQVKQSYLFLPRNVQISAVKEVCFLDSNGYPTAGYMRCSKVVRRPAYEDLQPDSGEGEPNGASSSQPSVKKARKGSDSDVPSATSVNVTAIADKDAALALQSLGLQKSSSSALISAHSSSRTSGVVSSGFDSHASDANTSEDTPTSDHQIPGDDLCQEGEMEFVCVIRPADASIPQGSSIMYQTYLSTASIVEHDRQRDDGSNPTGGEPTRGGSPSCSLSGDSGSDDKFGSGSGSSGQSNQKISNGTSSEAGSDESDSA